MPPTGAVEKTRLDQSRVRGARRDRSGFILIRRAPGTRPARLCFVPAYSQSVNGNYILAGSPTRSLRGPARLALSFFAECRFFVASSNTRYTADVFHPKFHPPTTSRRVMGYETQRSVPGPRGTRDYYETVVWIYVARSFQPLIVVSLLRPFSAIRIRIV